MIDGAKFVWLFFVLFCKWGIGEVWKVSFLIEGKTAGNRRRV